MANLNKVFLMGNLTRDPEFKYTTNGNTMSNIRIAVNRNFKTKDGEIKEKTLFLTVIVWGKQAEICNQYLSKGKLIFVEGRLEGRSWETPEGQKKSILEVCADRVQFLDKSSNKGV